MTDGEGPREGAETAHAVFVSYARADRRHALRIVALLERADISVWWDGRLEVGERFSEITERALESARAVIVLWSKTSIASHWVQDEAGRGRDRHRLIPVSIDGSMPPLGFRQFQVIDISRGRLKHGTPQARQIVYAVEQMLGRAEELEPPPPVGIPPGLSRRTIMAGTGAAALVAGGGVLAYASGLFGSKPEHDSVAVLPFKNLSGDPAQDYFSDGLSEELRATLSQDPQLAVAAQTSSNAFRGQNADAATIARKLKVAYILDGSVRRSGEVVRIIAQLIDGTSGFEKWSQIFDRKLADIFEVQTEISYLVADALVKQLSSGGEGSMSRIGGTANTEAYDAYLRGKALYVAAANEDEDRKALGQFDEAVRLDPDYAVAHAARSRSLAYIATSYLKGEELSAWYDKAVAAAQRAVEIAPDLAEAQSALGYTLLRGRLDIPGAQKPYEKSFELGFGSADILSSYAVFAGYVGEFGRARQAVARAEQLDPLNPLVFRDAGTIEFAARKFDAAENAFKMAMSLNPELGGVHFYLGDIAYLRGEFAAASVEYNKEQYALSRERGLAQAAFKLGDAEASNAALVALVSQFGDNSLYQQAQVQAQRGKPAEAMDLLERAYRAGDAGLVLSRTDPMLDPLRGNARFTALLQKMGFAVGSTN